MEVLPHLIDVPGHDVAVGVRGAGHRGEAGALHDTM